MKRLHALGCTILLMVSGCSSADDATGPRPGPADDDAGGAATASGGDPGADDGGTDMGPTDDAGAEPTDGGAGDAGKTACSTAYCDDFEAYTGAIADGKMLGPWLASVAGTGVMMRVDSVKPHAGAKSLHITVKAGATAHGTLGQKAAAGLVKGNDMFGRAMVHYAKGGTTDLPLGVHSWLFSSSGVSSEDKGGVNMNMGGGGASLQLNYHPPPPAPEQSVRGGTITANAWHCLEWEYDGAGNPVADTAKVWIDGTLAVDVPKSKGWKLATPWSAFEFGFTHYQTLTNDVDVYLDDFALDGARINCPK